MSFYLRKSVKVGPVRFNLSKSGIGVSTGIKGFRVGAGPRGNYVHMGTGGIYYRKTIGPGKSGGRKEQLSGAGGATPLPVPGSGNMAPPEIPPVRMTEIESADVSQMAHSSSSELLHELNTKKAIMRWWPGVLVGCLVVLITMMAAGAMTAFLFLWFLLSAAVVIWAYRRDIIRKTVVLLYDFDPAMEQAFGNLHRSASILRQCSKCWHIAASGSVSDGRYHAGASSVVKRNDTKVVAKPPEFLKTNVETVAIDVGRQTLYFFPDRLLVYDDGRIGAIGYDEISVQVEQTRFIEDGSTPRDAQVVDHTWRYVNKNGSPDKRFANNAQLPICLYDEIRFRSPSGLNEVIQVSRNGVGISLAETIRSFGRVARSASESRERMLESLLDSPGPASPPDLPVEQYVALAQPPGPPSLPTQTPPAAYAFVAAPQDPPSLPPGHEIPPPRPTDRLSHVLEVVSATRPPKLKKLQWVPSGTPVQIAGRTIQGMVYTCDVALGYDGEPSAICTTAHADSYTFDQGDLPYYPSYQDLTTTQRGFYLDWLARGRRDADPSDLPTGYLFLFFYGIERRIFVDGDFDPALWLEVQELLKVYGMARKSRSVRSYFGDFLHFTSYMMGPAGYSNVWESLLDVQGKKLSETALTLALANHYRTGTPVGWRLAHLVAMNLDDSRRSVVTERTGDAFKEMFKMRFEDLYPEGMILKASKRDQIVRYQTGNLTLKPRYDESRKCDTTIIKVPGVMGIKSQFKNLPGIWNQCIEDLSGYSRAIAKLSGDKAATNQDLLKAHLALPEELRSSQRHPLDDQFQEALDSCPTTGEISFMPVSLLAGLLGIDERTTLTQSQSDDVAGLVESLGFTPAPHPSILRLPLKWNQEVAIARCDPSANPTRELGGLLRLLYLAVLVASADGVVEEAELQVFHSASGVCDDYGRIQIAATEAALARDTNVASKQLLKIAKSVPAADRMPVFRLLVHIACCDDLLSSDENRLLRRIAKAFSLGDSALDDVLTEDSAFQTVTVSRGKTRTGGEAIPQPAEPETPGFSLDMDRIAVITAETAEVVSILSKALEEESEVEPEFEVPDAFTGPKEAASSVPDWAEDLEARYQPALLDLLSLPDNQAPDLTGIAGKYHLMVDDLVDGINAWSDEALGDFLIEVTDDGQASIQRDLIPNN